MQLHFVDTNYILRFLIPETVSLHQHRKTVDIFQKAALKRIKIYTSVIVFFEVYWTLRSVYKLEKSDCIQELHKILSMDFFEIEKRQLLVECVDLFNNTNLELPDCYNLLYSRQHPNSDFLTFDKKLQKYC